MTAALLLLLLALYGLQPDLGLTSSWLSRWAHCSKQTPNGGGCSWVDEEIDQIRRFDAEAISSKLLQTLAKVCADCFTCNSSERGLTASGVS